MKIKLLCMAVILAIAGTLAPATRPASAQDLPIILQTGHSVVLHIPGLTRVAVGNGEIAGVVPIGTSQLIINAKAEGHTSVFAWTSGGERQVYEVRVTNQVLDSLSEMIRAAVNQPNVQVVSFVHAIVLRGNVPDMQSFVDLQDLLDRFKPMGDKEKYTLVNAVTVTHSLGSLSREFSDVKGVHDLQIEPDGKGNIIVSGTVTDGAQATAVLARASELAGPYLASDGKVIDRLQRRLNTEVSIKVYVLEVDHSGAGDLGIQLQAANPVVGQPGAYTFGQPQYPIVENPDPSQLFGKGLNVGGFFRFTALAPTLNLVLSSGHARILSAPDLVTTPGNKATFLVGGQLPYVFSTGLGQVTVAFKNYGVQLNVTPTLLPNGSVETQINPDISDIDDQNAVELNGFFIPALKESTLSTDVITKPGESIVMGGLLRHIQVRTIQKIPLLADIPILGKLFQSTNYNNSSSDVVFVMTPEIISQ